MKNIASNKEYCARLLLNSIGASNFNIVTSLSAPKKPDELTYEELMTLLNDYLAPKKNVIVSQHQFLSIYQTDHQSISEFVTNLRSSSNSCEFISSCKCKAPVSDIFLRAQFIRGVRDNSIREQLLQSDTTEFKDIVAKAIALEASKLDSKLIAQKCNSALLSSNDIYKVSRTFGGSADTSRPQQRKHSVASKFKSNYRNKH